NYHRGRAPSRASSAKLKADRGKLLNRKQLFAMERENFWQGGAFGGCAEQAYGWSGGGLSTPAPTTRRRPRIRRPRDAFVRPARVRRSSRRQRPSHLSATGLRLRGACAGGLALLG